MATDNVQLLFDRVRGGVETWSAVRSNENADVLWTMAAPDNLLREVVDFQVTVSQVATIDDGSSTGFLYERTGESRLLREMSRREDVARSVFTYILSSATPFGHVPMWWESDRELLFSAEEIDINGTPTADMQIVLRAIIRERFP